MDLFEQDPGFNCLPYDGEVNYFGEIIGATEATHYFDRLLKTIEWKNDEVIIAGKHIITKRKVAWYGNKNYAYHYSNTTKHALPWTTELSALKTHVESQCGIMFNSCLLNLYHNGDEGMSWHSDDEKELGENPTIASFSLGSERKFSFKHKVTKKTVSMLLQTGSLLIMKANTQAHWLHSLPKTTKSSTPRINLTFRNIIKSD
ncbi:MAG: alpha-ketoglutarate-dependent dioxygenase AlkB [Gammaproteobacteria bacterium]|nr:alpha-ketoglutarate-dependent dioxygenase AlkB [Gammaproteobacteria bacterium]